MTNMFTICCICKEGKHKATYPMCWDCAKKPFTEEMKETLNKNGWKLCKECKSKWHKDRWTKCYTCSEKEKHE